MRTIQYVIVSVLISTLLIALNSCYKHSSPSGSLGDDAIKNTVVIGGLFSLTGNESTLGNASHAAMEIAVEDINEFLNDNGKNIIFDVDVKDTGLDPEAALQKLMELNDSGVKLVIGPISSAEVAVIKDFADDNAILIVSQSSTAGSLSIAGDNIFRFVPDDSQEAVAIATLMKRDGIDTIIPVFRNDTGNKGLEIATRASFVSMGGGVTDSIEYGTDTTDFSNVVEQLSIRVGLEIEKSDTKRVGVYLAGFDEVVDLFQLAKSAPILFSVRWYGSDGVVFSEALTKNTGRSSEFAENVYYPNPILGLDKSLETKWGPIADEIVSRSGVEPDAFALTVYDITWAIARAYVSAEQPSNIDSLKAAFVSEANSTVGITGSTKLNAAGDRKTANFDFWGVRRDGDVFIWKKIAFYDASSDTITNFE